MVLKTKVQTPMSKDDPTDVRVEEIPLPPPEMWAELDNSPGAAPTPSSAPATPAAPAAPEPEPERQVLRFTAATREKIVPLDHPFELDGREVTEVHVQRLALADVDRLLGAPGNITTFDIYATMTGLPAAVLRGMDDDDAVLITGACYDFLPRRLKPEGGPTATSGSGEATAPTSAHT